MEGIIKKRLRYKLVQKFSYDPFFYCDQRMICLNSNISVILKEMNRKEKRYRIGNFYFTYTSVIRYFRLFKQCIPIHFLAYILFK